MLVSSDIYVACLGLQLLGLSCVQHLPLVFVGAVWFSVRGDSLGYMRPNIHGWKDNIIEARL